MTVSSIFKCVHCGAFLCTHPFFISDNGRLIPLDATGNNIHSPHKCTVNPYVKRHYHFRQMPDRYAGEGKVRRFDRVHSGPNTTYDTPEGEHYHQNRYEWQCTRCNEVYAYRIKAMKCCTKEEYD